MDNRLGGFLRRHRLSAKVATSGGARLRREDIAARAGISTGYYAQLEQGRRSNPSHRVLTALAVALGLTSEEQRELLALAPRPTDPRHRARLAPPALARALAALDHLPASVLDASLRVVSSNPRWQGLHVAFTATDSLSDMVFLDASATDFYLDWHHAGRTVASLLGGADTGPDDRLETLDARAEIRRLREESPAFDRMWAAGPAPAVQRPVRLRVRHPVLGRLSYRHDIFVGDQSGRPGLHVLFPMNSETAALTALLDLYAAPGSRG